MSWHTEGKKINPIGGTLLADTGPISDGTAYIQIVSAATVLLSLLVQHRNADNDDNIQEFLIKVPANSSWEVNLGSVTIGTSGERIRAVSDGTIVGTAQVMISKG